VVGEMKSGKNKEKEKNTTDVFLGVGLKGTSLLPHPQ
jgi:hypothetical protein